MKNLFFLLVLSALFGSAMFTVTSCTQTNTVTIHDTIPVHDTLHDTAKCIDCLGAVACYSFSGNPADSSGHGYNGVVSNATLTNDRHGNANSAYSFSFSNSSYIELPTYQTILGSSNEFSVVMWLKFNGVDNGPTPLQLVPDNASDRFMIAVPYHPSASPADIYFDYGNISSGRYNLPIVTFTTWKHFAFVRSKVADNMKIYVDGVLLGTQSGSVDIGNKNRNFRIGGPGSGGETFNGSIDEVKIFDRALSDADVLSIYNKEK